MKLAGGDSETFLRRNQVAVYFVLAFAVSWIGIVFIFALSGIDLAVTAASDKKSIFFAMLLGPFIASLFLTARLEGRTGLRDVWQSFGRWNVGVQWYVLAPLLVPGLMLCILGSLSFLVSPAFMPRLHLELFAIGLVAGAFEEIGWTGFATPRLLANKGVYFVGFQLGLTWAAWHALADFAGNFDTMGRLRFLWFAIFWLAALPAYRILMTWVYAQTQSGLIAILMHAGYTGWLFALWPSTSVAEGLMWQSLFALSLWLTVAAIYLVDLCWRK